MRVGSLEELDRFSFWGVLNEIFGDGVRAIVVRKLEGERWIVGGYEGWLVCISWDEEFGLFVIECILY